MNIYLGQLYGHARLDWNHTSRRFSLCLQVNLFMRPLICFPVSPKSMAICGRCWNSMTWNFREKSHGILVVNLVGN